jgi:serine/threonine protein phosphatase PrpC
LAHLFPGLKNPDTRPPNASDELMACSRTLLGLERAGDIDLTRVAVGLEDNNLAGCRDIVLPDNAGVFINRGRGHSRLEDYAVLLPELSRLGDARPFKAFAVLDGLSSHPTSAFDSLNGGLSFQRFIREESQNFNDPGELAVNALKRVYDGVQEGFHLVKGTYAVLNHAQKRRDAGKAAILERPATTIAFALIFPDRVVTGNLGDTRCFKVTDGGVEALTKDHVSERGLITKAIGLDKPTDRYLEDAVRAHPFNPRADSLVLASDGVDKSILASQSHKLLNPEINVQDAVREVGRAAKNNSKDDITIIAYSPIA